MDAAPARARAPIGWALQVACGQSLPRLSRHRGPVALVMRRVSTALRSGSLPEFASPWSSTMVRWSVPAFLLRTPGGAPPPRRMYAPNPATPSLRSTAETSCSKFSVFVCGRRGSEEATLRARRAAISTPHVPPFPCYGGGGRDASNCARHHPLQSETQRVPGTPSTPARNDQSCVRDARAQRVCPAAPSLRHRPARGRPRPPYQDQVH